MHAVCWTAVGYKEDSPYARVIRLKPKLNRSLHLAIEKHDTFMEMNNNFSTITGLLNQYLKENSIKHSTGIAPRHPNSVELLQILNIQR